MKNYHHTYLLCFQCFIKVLSTCLFSVDIEDGTDIIYKYKRTMKILKAQHRRSKEKCYKKDIRGSKKHEDFGIS